MKLRIQGDSIRLRLTQSEVAHFAADGYVEATTCFGPGRTLTYALQSADAEELGAAFGDDTLAVFVPRAWATSWAASEQVGFDGRQEVGEGRSLALLVEKDFECLHKRPEEDDAFPHPLADVP